MACEMHRTEMAELKSIKCCFQSVICVQAFTISTGRWNARLPVNPWPPTACHPVCFSRLWLCLELCRRAILNYLCIMYQCSLKIYFFFCCLVESFILQPPIIDPDSFSLPLILFLSFLSLSIYKYVDFTEFAVVRIIVFSSRSKWCCDFRRTRSRSQSYNCCY